MLRVREGSGVIKTKGNPLKAMGAPGCSIARFYGDALVPPQLALFNW